ncbi:MAG: phage baseplate assembly protein V [Defluviitaleaceae bacterium]|nr:phage baseplate assembly protein V [Defluviitaleaceae bacterium]
MILDYMGTKPTDGKTLTNNQESTPSPFIRAKVVRNDDPKHPGEVKVSYTCWSKEKEETRWMPILTSYARKKCGIYWIPEVGDEVLVSYLDCRQEELFVVGSFYPVDDTERDEHFTKENYYKVIRTRGENYVEFYDKEGEQRITTKTPGDLLIKMDDDKETITIDDSKNDIVLNADEETITITGKKKIILQVGEVKITMDGESGLLKIEAKDIETNCKQEINVKAGTDINCEAENINEQASNTITSQAVILNTVDAKCVKIG